MSASEQAQALHSLLSSKVEHFFPQKTVRLTNYDKPFITAELKQLLRRKIGNIVKMESPANI